MPMQTQHSSKRVLGRDLAVLKENYLTRADELEVVQVMVEEQRPWRLCPMSFKLLSPGTR